MLRKNPTKEEKHLWYDFLSICGVKFTRQKRIGDFIVDFYCAKAKLAVEIDGSQHYSYFGKIEDATRTYIIEQYGIKVLRFLNVDIKTNFDGVCFEIDKVVKERTDI